MGGVIITGVKVVGICSKCRKEGDDIPKDIHGHIRDDKDISCVGCAVLGKSTLSEENKKCWHEYEIKIIPNLVILKQRLENNRKEFVKRLKPEFCDCMILGDNMKCAGCKTIDKLAGEESD